MSSSKDTLWLVVILSLLSARLKFCQPWHCHIRSWRVESMPVPCLFCVKYQYLSVQSHSITVVMPLECQILISRSDLTIFWMVVYVDDVMSCILYLIGLRVITVFIYGHWCKNMARICPEDWKVYSSVLSLIFLQQPPKLKGQTLYCWQFFFYVPSPEGADP